MRSAAGGPGSRWSPSRSRPARCPADRLAAIIWPGDAAADLAGRAARGRSAALRTALAGIGAGGQQVIVTTPVGYALAPGVEVDLRAAGGALRSAERAGRAGQARGRAGRGRAGGRAVRRAAAARRGRPWLEPHRPELDALALRALELIAESAGALGDHHRAAAAGRRAVAAPARWTSARTGR